MTDEIDDYVKWRNDVLLNGKPEDILPVLKARGHVPTDHETLLMTWHKSITSVQSLPFEYRMASKRWLSERGYQSLDDGDLGL